MWKSESNIWVWALFSHHRFQGLIWGHQTCIKCFYLLTYITSPKELCPLFCAMARKEVLARRHKEKRVWEKSSSGLERCQASTLSPSPWHPDHKYNSWRSKQPVSNQPCKGGNLWVPGWPLPTSTSHQFYDLNKANLCSQEFFRLGIHEGNPEGVQI